MRTEVPSFCRICEAECGIIATVEDGRILDVRADDKNPHSQGFMCTKPKAMIQILSDPDRVTTPLKRVGGPGEFEPVSWDEALGDIARRLKVIVDRHGGKAFATHTGNPSTFDGCGSAMIGGLRDAIGSPWNYGPGGDDVASFTAAAWLQLGSATLFLRPDVWHTDFLLVLGANPWVSKGSLISEPQLRKAMHGIVERGGRVVVVDPRRTETARQFEHVSIRPGTDAYLLLGLHKVILDEGLIDERFCAAHVNGLSEFQRHIADVDLEECSTRTGIPVETIVDIGRAFGAARAAAGYGRFGLQTQRFGTLNSLLLNGLNAVTGNINKRGAMMFSNGGALDFQKLSKAIGANEHGKVRSRCLNLPMSIGFLPTQSMWRDITEPGEGQVRALFTYGANPVLSSGAGGARLEAALETLELHVSLDIYVTETNKHAHYILPGATFYERADIPVFAMELEVRPNLYATERVVPPPGDVREEWTVLQEIAVRMGLGGAYSLKPLRWLAKAGIRIHPMTLLDAAIRTGPHGDLYGLRRTGWSLKKLREKAPHGVKLGDRLEPHRDLGKVLETPDGRIRLAPKELADELARLRAHRDDESFPLRSIGMRELKSHNSFMHNAPRFVPDTRVPTALINPDDARAAGLDLEAGDLLRIESASGVIVMTPRVTDEVAPGVVAVPHGWGHAGGWRRANAAGGANANVLTSAEQEDIEPLAGMSIISGIPIRISAVARAATGDTAVRASAGAVI